MYGILDNKKVEANYVYNFAGRQDVGEVVVQMARKEGEVWLHSVHSPSGMVTGLIAQLEKVEASDASGDG